MAAGKDRMGLSRGVPVPRDRLLGSMLAGSMDLLVPLHVDEVRTLENDIQCVYILIFK